MLVVAKDADAQFFESWFLDNGYQPSLVRSARESVEQLAANSYGLVVACSELLAGFDLDLFDKVRKQEIHAGLILYAEDGQRAVESIERGAFGFLKKPFDDQELQVMVSAAMSRVRGMQEARADAARLQDDREHLIKLHADNLVLLSRLGELHRMEQRGDLLTRAVQALDPYFEIAYHQVLTYDPMSHSFERIVSSSETLDDPMFALDDEELSFVVKNRTSALIPVDEARKTEFVEHGVRSILYLPLATHTTVMGAMVLYVGKDEFSSRFALEAAEHVGQAVTSTFEKIRMHNNLCAQSDLMDNIMESIPHGMIAVDLDDRIITLNRNAEMMFGIRRFLVLKEDFRSVLPDELAAVFSSLSLMALEGTGPANYELDHQLDDRTQLTIGISTSCIFDREGNQSGVLYICRDLSLSREVEKLRELDEMKSEFVHTVSHELKTPLTAIIGGTEILLFSEDLDTETREIVEIVDEGAKRLKSLISDLLDLSTLESGQVDLNEDEHRIAEVAEETLALLVNRGPCTLVREFEPDIPRILFDRAKIKQVMENLVSNAIKYSPDGGTVVLRIFTTADNHQQVSICDQGIGIPAAQLGNVFQKFFRVDSSNTAEIEGTGLGLSITKHIIEMHGGTIWVESVVGEGSTFNFKLPIRQQQLNAIGRNTPTTRAH